METWYLWLLKDSFLLALAFLAGVDPTSSSESESDMEACTGVETTEVSSSEDEWEVSSSEDESEFDEKVSIFGAAEAEDVARSGSASEPESDWMVMTLLLPSTTGRVMSRPSNEQSGQECQHQYISRYLNCLLPS